MRKNLAATMQLNAYLTFKGQCEEAFKFYEQSLGGQVGTLFRYAGTPLTNQVPADWQHKVMHGTVTVAGEVLMGADVAPDRYEEPKGFSLSIHIKGADAAERIFNAFADGGKVVVPLEQTFWAARFGVVVDRFGIPWVINSEETAS